ncbi:MAG: hypothetical protein UT05_C0019G0005 [Parcubacteria group bacterium GW2011_GWF2_38_76]|nr:MAG: hypothetical protein UT05_C0019G0005 [Parcubacteria group bacterium GW2011_GWF2_38_76]
MDFARLLHGPILGLIPAIAVIIVIFWAILKYGGLSNGEMNGVRTARTWVLIITAVGFGWYAIKMASVNVTPRAVIDRSIVEERKSVLEEDTHSLPPKVGADGKEQSSDTKGDSVR